MRRFIAEGAQVAFADRDGERGQRVAAGIEASGGHVVFVETHVEQEAEVAAFMQNAVDHGSVTDSCAMTPWRKGAHSSRAIARKALAGTHRTNHIDIQ